MTMYRRNAAEEPIVPEQPKRRARVVLIAVASIAAHAAVLVGAFASRAPAPATPKSATVQVVVGQVDPWTGDFHATGMRMARVRN